ncbi:uncharacterized protein LOC131626380 [Vicia villosa]|uniref:uncharacterized protein LOC131626380 n=1 Tax=Vicia villosa TaxID=3911 RepID=UPI00273BC442|nr:uncharacterized protein LOC131626380 [Vicia villosa]
MDVLKGRYGDLSSTLLINSKVSNPPSFLRNLFSSSSTSSSSIWWRDLVKINSLCHTDPMVDKVNFNVHNGFHTPFWETAWLDGISLKEEFPDLYLNSTLKGVSVAGMGGWLQDSWCWGDFGLRLEDNVVEAELVRLKDRVETFNGWRHGCDSVTWTEGSSLDFSVSSCYNFYLKFQIPYGPPNVNDGAFGFLWKAEVPFKIKAFCWRLFLDRLPMIDGLVSRGIHFPVDDTFCVLCGKVPENRDHFFFGCLVGTKIWNDIAYWIGKEGMLENKCLPHFMEWHLFFRSCRIRDSKLDVVWLATVWSFWLIRNGVRFRKEAWSINNTVWNIKFLVWKWSFCGEITHPNYSFYDFSKDPLLFLS